MSAQHHHYQETEDALRSAALAVSAATGDAVFRELVRALATILEVEMASIALPKEGDASTLRTLAMFLEGRVAENHEYPLCGTPCEMVIGREVRVYPSRLAELFPADTALARMGMESYAGWPLVDARGAPLGLIWVASRKPIVNPRRVESVLQIFGARAAAELERQRADSERAQLEASYRTIFEASDSGIYVHDWDSGEIVDVNPRASEMTGYSREELLRMNTVKLGAYPPEEGGAMIAEAIARARAGEAVRVEFHRRNKDGSLHLDEVSIKAAKIGGRPRMLVFAREITERRQAEEALRASEEQYRAIFNASEDALVLWDSRLRRVDVNPAYERLYGWSRDEVLGRGYEAHKMSPEYAERRLELVRRSLAGETCHAELESFDKNGKRFQADIRTIPVMHRGERHVLTIARNITERRQREEALRASEEQYRAIFNATSDALVLRDADFRIVDVNSAYEAMSGKRRDEWLGMTELTLTRNASAVDRRHLHAEALRGKPMSFEADGWRPDGTHFVLEVRSIPMTYRGEPHVLYIGRDITARKAAEGALRASEEQYRAIFNASFDGMIIRTLDGEIVDVNPALLAMYGYTREELIGQTIGPIIPGHREKSFRGYLAEVAAGRPFRTESHVPRKDGSKVHIEVLGSPLTYRGKPHVLSVVRDISERKVREEALRASEEQYRAIFDASLDALVLRDAQFRIVDVNPSYERMSGYARAEVVGADRVIANPPAIDGQVKALHRQALDGEPVRMETQMVRRDGRPIEIELSGVRVLYQGQPHVLYSGRDITERKHAETRHRELEAQLRQAQKMEAIGQLTGGIAHDFNNILTGIMGYLVLAGERQAALGDEKLARHLEQAQQGARRARDLIRQMLTFSRAQKGASRAIALAPLIEESAGLLGSSLPSSIELRTAIERDLPSVAIDPVQLEQILLNLCINARDAMDGVGTIRIGVRLAAHDISCTSCHQAVSGRFVEVYVKDSGHGIAPHVMQRMFEPFFSTKEVGRGSGMGLAMVHGIVHEHGGHVLVESNSSAGTTFRVLLPALEEARDGARSAPKVKGRAAARRHLQGRVLVVDDEAMVGDFLAELLEGWGLKVKLKRGPGRAEEWLSRDPARIDLVITDQTMPKMTGLEFAGRLGRLCPGLPVILCTGYAENISAAQLEAAGVRALLRKPVDPEELFALLAKTLRSAPRAAKAPRRSAPRAAPRAAGRIARRT